MSLIDAKVWRERYPPFRESDWYSDSFVQGAALRWALEGLAAGLYGLCVAIGPRFTPDSCMDEERRIGIPEHLRYVCGGCADGYVRWLRWYDGARYEYGDALRNYEIADAAFGSHDPVAGVSPTKEK